MMRANLSNEYNILNSRRRIDMIFGLLDQITSNTCSNTVRAAPKTTSSKQQATSKMQFRVSVGCVLRSVNQRADTHGEEQHRQTRAAKTTTPTTVVRTHGRGMILLDRITRTRSTTKSAAKHFSYLPSGLGGGGRRLALCEATSSHLQRDEQHRQPSCSQTVLDCPRVGMRCAP